MVNKPHAPRSNKPGSKKPQASASTINGEDTSYIVFGNDKPGKKGKQTQNAPAATTGKGKAADASTPGAQPEAEKKPDTRTLIAGSSWTGKLPQTLFNEHCQKQRWERPEYTIHKANGGFTGAVILKQKHPKTGEITVLPPITPPRDYNKELGVQPSAVEARHFAAAYALFRVSNMKNIHMMLPPQYRDLWKGDFLDLKSEATAQGQGYLYEADPFAAKKAQDLAQVAKEKARADKAKVSEQDKKNQVVSLDGQVQSKHVLKGWQRVPKVEMGGRTRKEVERLVRTQGVWNPHNVRLSQEAAKRIVEDLSATGFRRSHVAEAAEVCKDREECLEWLLIHIPEDDLPKWALPENYSAGVSMASSDLKREGKLKRLAASGYAMDACVDVLDACRGDECQAADRLQKQLLGDETEATAAEQEPEDFEAWDEELETLAAIFGERFTKHERMCTLELELKTPTKKSITLRARPPTKSYPNAAETLIDHLYGLSHQVIVDPGADSSQSVCDGLGVRLRLCTSSVVHDRVDH